MHDTDLGFLNAHRPSAASVRALSPHRSSSNAVAGIERLNPTLSHSPARFESARAEAASAADGPVSLRDSPSRTASSTSRSRPTSVYRPMWQRGRHCGARLNLLQVAEEDAPPVDVARDPVSPS